MHPTAGSRKTVCDFCTRERRIEHTKRRLQETFKDFFSAWVKAQCWKQCNFRQDLGETRLAIQCNVCS